MIFFFWFRENEEEGVDGDKGKRELFLILSLSLSFPISTHKKKLSHLVPHQERRVPLEDPRSRHAHRPLVDLDAQEPRPLFAAEPLFRRRELGEVAEEDVGRGAVGAEGVVLVLADEDDLKSW